MAKKKNKRDEILAEYRKETNNPNATLQDFYNDHPNQQAWEGRRRKNIEVDSEGFLNKDVTVFDKEGKAKRSHGFSVSNSYTPQAFGYYHSNPLNEGKGEYNGLSNSTKYRENPRKFKSSGTTAQRYGDPFDGGSVSKRTKTIDFEEDKRTGETSSTISDDTGFRGKRQLMGEYDDGNPLNRYMTPTEKHFDRNNLTGENIETDLTVYKNGGKLPTYRNGLMTGNMNYAQNPYAYDYIGQAVGGDSGMPWAPPSGRAKQRGINLNLNDGIGATAPRFYKDGGELPKYQNGLNIDLATATNIVGTTAGTLAPIVNEATTSSVSGTQSDTGAFTGGLLQGASTFAPLAAAGPVGIAAAGVGTLGMAAWQTYKNSQAKQDWENKIKDEQLQKNTLAAENVEDINRLRSQAIIDKQTARPDTSMYQEYYGGQGGVNPFMGGYNPLDTSTVFAEDGGTILEPVAEIETNEVVKAKDGTYLAKGATHENGGIEMAYDGGGNPVATNGGTLQKINDIGTDGPTEISSDNIFFSSEEWSKYKNA